MSGRGQKAKCSSRGNGFRFATNIRHCVMLSALRIRANISHGKHPEMEATLQRGSAPPMLRERGDNPTK
jgi:hypothetical protein